MLYKKYKIFIKDQLEDWYIRKKRPILNNNLGYIVYADVCEICYQVNGLNGQIICKDCMSFSTGRYCYIPL
jgi:hypothetical protein